MWYLRCEWVVPVMRQLIFTLVGLLAVIHAAAAVELNTLRVNPAEDFNSPYALKMLELVNQKLDWKYTVEIVDDGVTTKSRIVQNVVDGNYHVFWNSTNAENEETLLPIRIPLFKGLLGHRIFIIREGEQDRFDQIKTIDELRKVSMGTGAAWGDTSILSANGMNLVLSNNYPSMFIMLDGNRFDAFPRGVFEAFKEVEDNEELGLAVEKNILLVYEMPYYFFVNRDNKELADDLTRGLEMAIEDGSFDQLFLNFPTVQDAINKANLQDRRIFNLTNYSLSKETPLDRPELWVDVKSMCIPQQNSPKLTAE